MNIKSANTVIINAGGDKPVVKIVAGPRSYQMIRLLSEWKRQRFIARLTKVTVMKLSNYLISICVLKQLHGLRGEDTAGVTSECFCDDEETFSDASPRGKNSIPRTQ